MSSVRMSASQAWDRTPDLGRSLQTRREDRDFVESLTQVALFQQVSTAPWFITLSGWMSYWRGKRYPFQRGLTPL